jgi:hypothetical protein
MGRTTFLRAFVIAVVTVLAYLPASALGAKPDREHATFVDTEENVDVCGVNVDILAKGVFTDLTFFDKQGHFLRFRSLSTVNVVFTADDGRSVMQHTAGAFVVEEVVDEEAGTLTTFFTFKGLPNQLRTAHGRVVLRDVGFITFAEVVDLDTGDILSFEIVVNKGPHPEADSDFTIFCDAFIEALG